MYIDATDWVTLVGDLKDYYKVDSDECNMTHEDWIRIVATAMLNDNSYNDFYYKYEKSSQNNY